jgi:hypothetical protein
VGKKRRGGHRVLLSTNIILCNHAIPQWVNMPNVSQFPSTRIRNHDTVWRLPARPLFLKPARRSQTLHSHPTGSLGFVGTRHLSIQREEREQNAVKNEIRASDVEHFAIFLAKTHFPKTKVAPMILRLFRNECSIDDNNDDF